MARNMPQSIRPRLMRSYSKGISPNQTMFGRNPYLRPQAGQVVSGIRSVSQRWMVPHSWQRAW